MTANRAVCAAWADAWLLDGKRTPFANYNGPLALVSPIDLGIKAARAAIAQSEIDAADIGTVIAGNMAQASFDAYMLPRHIRLYSGVPTEVPAHLVQRVCGTGIEVLTQAADAVTHRGVDLALCVGTESMSRNPVASYTSRAGFRMGQVEFKDFLWEALGGVQTGGNSSAVVDGAAAGIVCSGPWARAQGRTPLGRILACAAVGCPPEIMGIGPAPAIRALLEKTGLELSDIDRIEINEAFGAQVMACSRELGLDEDRLNVSGGSIAIGHPLGATGIRLALTVARELQRAGLRRGIASACIGGGQGIAMLIDTGVFH